ncbi:MAG TPA: enoyl-CoA hydratase/isomerase family protein [Ramlibacter sp.]|nr:enoyl-CoA hydratase/isomerase family protein [Ramlibacter sp.]
MSDGAVRLYIDGAIAHVTFDRPDARNAMTWAMYSQLAAICDDLTARGDIRCAVFRGAGGEAFVAGTDIEQFRAFQSGDDGLAYEKQIDSGISKIECLPMPTLAVIEGWCVGGGIVIATACDIRIGTPSAKFGVPIARTLGNCLSIANIARLVAVWGKPRVQRMLLAAEILDANEAQSCGYLAEVIKSDIGIAAAERAHKLAALAPVTQAVSKEALRRLTVRDLPNAEDLIRRAYASEDFREGVTAFAGKRPAHWHGR